MASDEVEKRLATLQRQQDGVCSRQQALAIGLPPGAFASRVRSGRYERLHPGVVCVAGAPLTWRGRVRAALLWAGGDAVAARGTAARLHGLPDGRGPTDIRLLVGVRCPAAPPGVRVHRTRNLSPGHVTAVDGLRLTTVARTLCDLAGERSPQLLRRLVAAASREGHTSGSELRSHLAELGRVRGAVRLRRLADELSPLEAGCRSEIEAVYVRAAIAAGMPPTAVDLEVRCRDGRRRYLDAVHLPERLPIEIDSEYFHTGPLDVADDRARERHLEVGVAWHRPVRLSEAELRADLGGAVARVAARLAAIREGQAPALTRPARLVPPRPGEPPRAVIE